MRKEEEFVSHEDMKKEFIDKIQMIENEEGIPFKDVKELRKLIEGNGRIL